MQNSPMPNMSGAGAVTDTLEFVKNLWGGMGVPGMAAPTLSVDDLDKKITDLKAVEAWLALNSSMVRGTIQALEVQRGTLAALKSMGDAFAKAAAQPAAGKEGPSAEAGAAAPQFTDPAAWWNMLQDQFKQAVTTAMSPDAMAEATARAHEAAGKMAAAMPGAEMGKAVVESMTNAAGAAPKKSQGKPRAAKPGASAE